MVGFNAGKDGRLNEKYGITKAELRLWLELAGCFGLCQNGFEPLFPEKSIRQILKSASKRELQGILVSLLAELRKYESSSVSLLTTKSTKGHETF